MLRAFGLYFQLANTAEQHHRIRRRREVVRRGSRPRASRSPRHSTGSTAVPPDELERRLGQASLQLVLTAHPTEATRRTLLRAHVRIAGLLARIDDPDLTPAERDELEEQLAEEITILWQTDEVRHDRPRVGDEIRHGLWFFEESLFDAGERLLRDYRQLRRARRRRSRSAPGSAATSTATRRSAGRRSSAALERARESVLGRYRDDVRELSVALSSSRSLVGVSAELEESIARDERECTGYRDDRRLDDVDARATARSSRTSGGGSRTTATTRPRSCSADLAVIRRSLEANRGARVADGPPRGAGAPRRAVRLPRRQARRAPPLERGARADRPHARRVRGGRGRARPPRRAGARHGHRLGDDERRPTSSRVLDLTAEPVAVVPLFETIADLEAAPRRPCASCSPTSATAPGSPSAGTGSR